MKVVPLQVTLVKHSGTDLDVVNAARVSFNKESASLDDRDIRLIKYLAKHNHFTPFCHNSLTFRIKAPIFLARQLHKHVVGGIVNEVSRRYVDEEPEFYIPTLWHKAPENAKQGTSQETIDKIWWIPEDSYYSVSDGVAESTQQCLRRYNKMIECGIAPEEARMVLPLNTMTEWIWTGSLMFFARVYNQRSDSHAQLLAQEFAEQLANLIPEDFKHSWEALTNHE